MATVTSYKADVSSVSPSSEHSPVYMEGDNSGEVARLAELGYVQASHPGMDLREGRQNFGWTACFGGSYDFSSIFTTATLAAMFQC